VAGDAMQTLYYLGGEMAHVITPFVASGEHMSPPHRICSDKLIRNRDRVVSKDDLLANVWDGRIVSESTLTSSINAVRKAVGDSGGQQSLVRTVARKRCRWVSSSASSPRRLPSACSSPPALRTA